jgi:hypothetical protein
MNLSACSKGLAWASSVSALLVSCSIAVGHDVSMSRGVASLWSSLVPAFSSPAMVPHLLTQDLAAWAGLRVLVIG